MSRKKTGMARTIRFNPSPVSGPRGSAVKVSAEAQISVQAPVPAQGPPSSGHSGPFLSPAQPFEQPPLEFRGYPPAGSGGKAKTGLAGESQRKLEPLRSRRKPLRWDSASTERRRFRLVLRYRQDDPKERPRCPLPSPSSIFAGSPAASPSPSSPPRAWARPASSPPPPSTPSSGAKLSGHLAWAGAPTATYQGGAALARLRLGPSHGPAGSPVHPGPGRPGRGARRRHRQRRHHPRVLRPCSSSACSSWASPTPALQLGRFVAAEVHAPLEKGTRDLATWSSGAPWGRCVGPSLVGPSGRLATRHGLDELAGPYLGSARPLPSRGASSSSSACGPSRARLPSPSTALHPSPRRGRGDEPAPPRSAA